MKKEIHFTQPECNCHMIRIDRIANGQVYFVSWLDHQEIGVPKRMTIEVFKEACVKQGMRLK